jgi:response regulator NasT
MNPSGKKYRQEAQGQPHFRSDPAEPVKAGNRLRVLIAEDDPLAAIGMRLLVTNLGHQVVAEARTGKEAINQAMLHKPDLILMDVKMPGDQDGIEATRVILSSYDSASVILVTAYHDEETIQRGKKAGALAYLIKPISEHELRAAVKKVNTGPAN